MELYEKIEAVIKRELYNTEAIGDMFEECRNIEKVDFAKAHRIVKSVRRYAMRCVRDRVHPIEGFQVYRKTLLFDAPYYLDEYLLYLEIDREPEQRFYQPRRKQLLRVVRELQALEDGELQELFVSLPVRTGKSSLMIFFMTWILGKHPELANLYCSYTDIITKAFNNGVLEILTDSVTYKWADVFPEAKIVSTNAAEETLNIDRKKHYPSLTCRSLYGTLNGACDCNGYLMADDLISGIEEALNKDRLMSAWMKVDSNMLTRAKANAKILWIGTRWSVIDPIGLRRSILEEDEAYAGRKYKVIDIPALDYETDESNFDYDYGVGFSTEYFKQRRASYERNGDMASWNAIYQAMPIEREGTVFAPDELRYFNGDLPSDNPDRIVMVVDPGFGGGDYTAAPVGFVYGEDVFIVDAVFTNDEKQTSIKLCADAIAKYGVNACQVEANKSTELYTQYLGDELKKRGVRTSLTSKPAPTNKSKEARIFDQAGDIRTHFVFLSSNKRSKDYTLFMQNVFSFKITGKNKHDDAPDSLSMLSSVVFFGKNNHPTFFKRPF